MEVVFYLLSLEYEGFTLYFLGILIVIVSLSYSFFFCDVKSL